MIAEILSIGDEILIGNTVNTNAAFICQRLTEIGVVVKWITVVGDNEQDLTEAIKVAEKRADVIISTGGLGPTHDDLTKNIFAEYFHTKLRLNQNVLQDVKRHFSRRGLKMPAINIEQAMVPENATIIKNEEGTAPGLLFQKEKKYFFVLPGVPLEMKRMIERDVIPFLKKKEKLKITMRTIKTFGIGESALFEKLGDIKEIEKNVKLAFLPGTSGVEIRITVRGDDEKKNMQHIKAAEDIIREKLSDFIWGVDRDTLENMVAKLLINHKETVTLLEVGTRGLVFSRFNDIPENEKFLKSALVLSPEVAINIFKELKELNGEEFACALAKHARVMSYTDYGVAISTFYKKESNTNDLASEFVYIAVADSEDAIVEKQLLKIDHNFNKQRASQLALDLLRRKLIKK